MTCVWDWCRFAVLLAAAFAVPAHATPQPVIRLGGAGDAPHARPSLIARTEAAQRGGEVEIALRLRLDPGWHVYWENPGDAGMPPSLKWTLPDGAAVSAIDWPAPHHRVDEHGLATYLYEGDVVLPMRLTLVPGFAADRLELVADASWLVCQAACLPGRARLPLALPVTDLAPAADAATAALFASADARRPAPLGPGAGRGAVLRGDAAPGRFSLDIDAGGLEALGGGPVAARIMPAAPGLIDEAAPHTAAWTPDGTLRVTAPRAAADPAPTDARGFVELRGADQTLILRFGPPAAEPSR